MSVLSRKPIPPPIPYYCADCGVRLIKFHTVITRRDDSSFAAVKSYLKPVEGYCVYEKAHEDEKKQRRQAR